MLPKYSLWRAQRRRILACTVALAASLALPRPGWSQPQPAQSADSRDTGSGTPIGMVSGGRHTAETAVLAPEYTGSFLSLLVPGAGQMYAGNPVRAAIYLGLAVAAGSSVYSALLAGDNFVTPEERAFAGLIGYGTSFGVGIVSTLDALADISGRYQAAEEALVPPAMYVLPDPAGVESRPGFPRRNGSDE